MLTIKEKIDIFEKYLDEKNSSYGDIMKDELHFFFFINEYSFDFLNKLSSRKEVINKVDFLISKMILHEDEDGLYNIIESSI